MRAKWLSVALLLPSIGLAGESAVRWRRDYAAVRAEAEKSGKLILVNVHASWCGPCQRMLQTTFSDRALARWMEERCVPLGLDGDADAAFIQQLGVRVFPTTIIAAADGRILDRVEGFADVQQTFALLTRCEAQNTASRPSAAPKTTVVAATSTPSKAAANPPSPIGESVTAPTLALSGYCPVAMLERAELIKGRPEFNAVQNGKRFQFTDAAARARFLAAPAKFQPAENGNCVVTWIENKRWMQGTIEHPAMFERQLFLFPNDGLRDKFLRDPDRYVDRNGRAYR